MSNTYNYDTDQVQTQYLEKTPPCQCNGPGYCPMLGTHVSEAAYESCQHNDAWRKDALQFYKAIRSPAFEAEIINNPKYQESQELKQQYIADIVRELDNEEAAQKAAKEAYIAVRKKQEEEYVNKLTPAQQELYFKRKEEQQNIRNSKFIVDNQLNEVISTMAKEGITPDNYEEKKEGLGDAISKALSKIGLTSDAVEKLLGLHGGCGCDKRKKFLNKLLPFSKKE